MRACFFFHITVLHRLGSGRLLFCAFSHFPKKKTVIESGIYGISSRRTKTAQFELESTKKEVESELEWLELRQKLFLHGRDDLQSRPRPKTPKCV